MIIAGDIGGTKVDLAAYDADSGPRSPVVELTFHTNAYTDIVTPLMEFVHSAAPKIGRCILGAAGPVVDGRAVGVNVPWRVDERELSDALGVPVTLLNDLEALAYAVPFLAEDDVIVLQAGVPEGGGAKAIVAPGTGLGEGYLTWDGRRYRPHPSEGGHADFAPTDALQTRLLVHMLGRHDHVSYERVCSGLGLPNLYAFLRDVEGLAESEDLARLLEGGGDPTPCIVQHGLSAEPDPLSARSLSLFAAILGAEAGNLALRYVATGGVYIGGGMSVHMLPAYTDGQLLSAFLSKGRLRFLVERMPLYVITRPKAGLYGAACYGLRILA